MSPVLIFRDCAEILFSQSIMTGELPKRLPDSFIWSSSGQRHVDYPDGEGFEGELGTYLGRSDLGDGGQATVSVVVVRGKAVARKRMTAIGVDDEARREASTLERIVHQHVRSVIQLPKVH
jgi:hypothetical protein